MARKIRLPGTDQFVIHTGSSKEADRHEAIINARYAFTVKYAKEKGWGERPEDLTIDQILEIREQPEWQDPLKEQN